MLHVLIKHDEFHKIKRETSPKSALHLKTKIRI